MRGLMIGLGLIITVFVLGALWTTPAVKRLSICLKTSNSQLNEYTDVARQQKLDKHGRCQQGKVLVEDLKACYQHVEKSTYVPLPVITTISKLLKPGGIGIEKWISLHNNSCTEFPDLKVD